MNIFHDEHIALLKILIKHNVEFILIGGLAVNYYGYHRPTGDVDVWLNPESANKKNLINVMYEIGIDEDSIKTLQEFDFSKPTAFHIGNKPPFIIDFITKIVGVHWKEAWEMKNEAIIDNVKVNIIHFNHLIQNKIISGRPKDLDDIQKLNRIDLLQKKNS